MKKTDFNLKKVKVDGKTVVINYTKVGSDEEIQSTKKNAPHPDMRTKLNRFKTILVDILQMPEENDELFNISGIVLSTLKGKQQVMIMSNYVAATGHRININSHNISCAGEDYVSQDKLTEMIDAVIEEVHAYLFKDKQAQLSIDDNIEEEETVKEEKE